MKPQLSNGLIVLGSSILGTKADLDPSLSQMWNAELVTIGSVGYSKPAPLTCVDRCHELCLDEDPSHDDLILCHDSSHSWHELALQAFVFDLA